MFSLLSDDLLIYIISFLPTKYAVFTSILSKRWKFLWCYAGNSLDFDVKLWCFGESFVSSVGVEVRCFTKCIFSNFVDRVLGMYKVPWLQKFTLRCNGYDNTDLYWQSHKSWIDHAVRQRKVKEVEIYMDEQLEDGMRFSFGVFNSDALQVLKLQCSDRILSCGLSDANFLCYPNLKVFHLSVYDLHWVPQLFSRLFSAAPRLEEAFLGGNIKCHSNCDHDFKHYLQAPNLKKLRLSFESLEMIGGDFLIDAPLLEEFFIVDDCYRHLVLKGVSSLVTAKVNVGVPYLRKIEDEPCFFDRVHKILHGLATTKFLYLRGCTMDILSIADHNLRKFSNLSHLQLRVLNYFSWDALPKLLQSAPNLKVLVLKKEFKNWWAKFNESSTWCPPKEVPVCLSKTLLEIKMWDCEARQVELDLISYLLQNGKALNTFMVDFLPHSSEEQLKFFKKLMVIPKGSATCQIKISTLPACPRMSSPWPEKALELWSIPQQLTYKDLKLFTDGFDNKNLISITPLYKVYRGKMPQHGSDSKVRLVTVKEWRIADHELLNKYIYYMKKVRCWVKCDPEPQLNYNEYFLHCFHDELKLLQHPNFCSHPCFMRLLGYSVEGDNERLGIVYDNEPLDSLETLIPKDSFNWLQRIKVALGLACILEYMHKKTETLPIEVQNIDVAYVMLDQDYNPALFDFTCVSRGIFPIRDICDVWRDVCSCTGWTQEFDTKPFSDANPDVFMYGIVLLSLISKRIYERNSNKRKESNDLGIYDWAVKEYRPQNMDCHFHQHENSLVHQSLKAHPSFVYADGLKITRLAMHCVDRTEEQPNMKGVVKCLLRLHVVKQYWDFLECDKMLSFLDIEFPSHGNCF